MSQLLFPKSYHVKVEINKFTPFSCSDFSPTENGFLTTLLLLGVNNVEIVNVLDSLIRPWFHQQFRLIVVSKRAY